MATWEGNIVINTTSKSDHIYLVGGNHCNAFCFGEIGDEDDFFLVGAEADAETNYPMLTGNFLSSEKELLFRIERNVLTINPGKCSRILSDDHIGYKIHDSAGEEMLAIRTTWVDMEGTSLKLITTLAGKFYDKSGRLVLHAKSGDETKAEVNTKALMGWPRYVVNYKPTEAERMMLQSALIGGIVLRPITGRIADTTLELDGKFLWNAEITNCDIILRKGDFQIGGSYNIHHNRIRFLDNASRIYELYKAISDSQEPSDKTVVQNPLNDPSGAPEPPGLTEVGDNQNHPRNHQESDLTARTRLPKCRAPHVGSFASGLAFQSVTLRTRTLISAILPVALIR
jgi:hypothetical protein